MSIQTPRILPSHLHAFHPSSAHSRTANTVRLLGTVTALRGETAIITCDSHGDVTLQLKADSHLQMGRLVEVVGKVVVLDGGQVSSYPWEVRSKQG
jgi:Replication factor A protein 3